MESETSETKVILPPTIETPVYLVYPRRFYILFVFSFLTFNQCLIWLTFSPIARSTEAYYNITESTVDLLLNWGPIIFIPCLPLTSILLNRPNGLRHCVILLAITDFVAALFRIVPSIILSSASPNFNSIALPFIHVGQILNAACGPLVMAPVSQISSLWFAPHERTRATTIAIFANNFGATVGFVISPYIVSLPQHVPNLLYVHFGLAFAACILALIYFPANPPSAPSAAAELLILNPTSSETVHDWRRFLKDCWKCLTTPAFLLLSTAGGLLYGTFSIWTSLYDLLLKPEGYSEEQAGWFGFGSTLAGVIGGVGLSYIADKRYFQHSLKALILTSFIGCLLAIIWFELSVHSLFYDKHILSSTVVTIGLSTGLAGLFSGGAQSLIYEALAEIMYPLPESLSASILVQWINVVTLVFLFVAPNRDTLVNFLVLVVMVVCIIMALVTRFSYRRRDEDERKRIEKEQNQVINHNNLNEPINDIINEQQQYGTFT
jgi:FLVCR family MFS transporter